MMESGGSYGPLHRLWVLMTSPVSEMDILTSVLWIGRISDTAAIFVLVNGYPQFIPLDTRCVLHCEAWSHWRLKVIAHVLTKYENMLCARECITNHEYL